MISKETAIDILKCMLHIRYVEESIARKYRDGYMKCPVHLYIGQEAVAAGVCLNLQKEDYVTTNHRSHGHYLAKGGDLNALLEEIYGLSSGCAKGWGGSQHLYAPEIGILGTSAILGGNISIGTGIAWAIKNRGLRAVSAVFLGDGGTEEGYFYESLNFASLKKLPVLYVCENNLLATHSRIEHRRANNVKLHRIAESLGVKAVELDGNDAAQIFLKAKKIISSIRKDSGPFFIELMTYRWKGHVTPDEDFGDRYRTMEEIDKWKLSCPIKRFEELALKNSLLTIEEIDAIKSNIISSTDKVFANVTKNIQIKKAELIPHTPY